MISPLKYSNIVYEIILNRIKTSKWWIWLDWIKCVQISKQKPLKYFLERWKPIDVNEKMYQTGKQHNQYVQQSKQSWWFKQYWWKFHQNVSVPLACKRQTSMKISGS